MNDEVRWIALGMALGNKALMTRMLAEIDELAFLNGPASMIQLWRAMASGKEAVQKWLVRASVPNDGTESAVHSIVAAVAAYGERRWQREFAAAAQQRSAMMTPEAFQAWVADQLAKREQRQSAVQKVASK